MLYPCRRASRALTGARAGLCVAAALAAACGPGAAFESTTRGERVGFVEEGVVIGRRDIRAVEDEGENVPPRYRALLDAIGVLEPSGCTVTHVGSGRVLTAGHCVGSVGDHCQDLTVRWGVRGRKRGSSSTCTRVVATEWNHDRDVALFEVDAPPLAFVAMELCREPELGTLATIFGHPRAAPLVWAGRCAVEPAALSGRGDDAFSHACDTESGMSGAAILDDTSLRIIGVHGGGRGRWNFGTFITAAPFARAAARADRND